MKLGSVYFHYLQWYPLPSVASFKQDLTGKNVIVTGSNVGLGLEAARHLATMNPAKLILGCRDISKAEAAKESIVKSTGVATSVVECWKLDQSDFASVSAFADRFESEIGVLDLLIANAGVSIPGQFIKTVDGWETVLQVNHLSTALLSFRLLPSLTKAAASPPTPRLVIVSSDVHYWASLPEASAPKILELLGSEAYCTQEGVMAKRYGVSKLMNVFFTRALAARLPPTTAVTVNAVNPGLCHSDLSRNRKGGVSFRNWLWKAVNARSTEVGSRTLLHAALSKDLQGVSGKFTNCCAIAEEADLVLSVEGKHIQDRVWEETLEILEKVDPKVQGIISEYLV